MDRVWCYWNYTGVHTCCCIFKQDQKRKSREFTTNTYSFYFNTQCHGRRIWHVAKLVDWNAIFYSISSCYSKASIIKSGIKVTKLCKYLCTIMHYYAHFMHSIILSKINTKQILNSFLYLFNNFLKKICNAQKKAYVPTRIQF